MSTWITTAAASADVDYTSEDEAFPPLPRGSPLRGFRTTGDQKATSKNFTAAPQATHSKVSEELFAAAALMGVGQHRGQTTSLSNLSDSAVKVSELFALPIVSERIKRIVNPNAKSPKTLTKVKGVRLVCQVCQYETNHSSHMTRHMRAHTGNKPHACEHCKYRCSQKANLIRHIRSRHTNVKPFACPHCDYRSTQKSHIEGHVRSRHLVQFKVVCSECDYVSTDAKSMHTHMLSSHGSAFSMATAIAAGGNGSCQGRTTNNGNKKRKRGGGHAMFVAVEAEEEEEEEEEEEHPSFPGFWTGSALSELKDAKNVQVVKQPFYYTSSMTNTTRTMYKQNVWNHVDQTLMSMFDCPVVKKQKTTNALVQMPKVSVSALDLSCCEEEENMNVNML